VAEAEPDLARRRRGTGVEHLPGTPDAARAAKHVYEHPKEAADSPRQSLPGTRRWKVQLQIEAREDPAWVDADASGPVGCVVPVDNLQPRRWPRDLADLAAACSEVMLRGEDRMQPRGRESLDSGNERVGWIGPQQERGAVQLGAVGEVQPTVVQRHSRCLDALDEIAGDGIVVVESGRDRLSARSGPVEH
jgi:hypothetical protein